MHDMLAQCATTIRRQYLCEQVSQICHSILFSNSEDFRSHRLTNGVVIDCVVLLRQQHRRWDCRILNDTVVVTENICWTIDRYSEHAEFAA
jgi:hypothetical protein